MALPKSPALSYSNCYKHGHSSWATTVFANWARHRCSCESSFSFMLSNLHFNSLFSSFDHLVKECSLFVIWKNHKKQQSIKFDKLSMSQGWVLSRLVTGVVEIHNTWFVWYYNAIFCNFLCKRGRLIVVCTQSLIWLTITGVLILLS